MCSDITGKFAAVQFFHRMEAQVETVTSFPLIKGVLNGIARSHGASGTARRVRLPVTWGMLRDGGSRIPNSVVRGRAMWL